MNFRNLFFADYWFSQPRLLTGLPLTGWVVIAFILGVVGVAALWFRRRAELLALRRWWGRLAAWGLTLGALLALWVWWRQERVWILGWRWWLIPWTAFALGWGAKLGQYRFKRLPAIRAEQAARAAKEKYLTAAG